MVAVLTNAPPNTHTHTDPASLKSEFNRFLKAELLRERSLTKAEAERLRAGRKNRSSRLSPHRALQALLQHLHQAFPGCKKLQQLGWTEMEALITGTNTRVM